MSEPITFAPAGWVTVGTLTVRRPSDADVDRLAGAFRGLLEAPGPLLVALDFSHVEFFEATLRGKLIWLYKHLRDRGGRLALCRLGPMASHPTMVEFGRIFPIRDTLEEAIRTLEHPLGEAGG